MELQYIVRRTGQIEQEKIYGRWALTLLYGTSRLSRMIAFLVLPLLTQVPWLSRLYGKWQDHPLTARKVIPFIREFQIDSSEFATSNFHSFNDFFTRKLKPEARPIIADPNRLSLPADGRYLVFPDLTQVKEFYIKGQRFDLKRFLGDETLAQKFADGSMVIARLCPTDYHRVHFPCDGNPGPARPIPGALFSVHPFALRKRPSILWENKREITEIKTNRLGQVLFVEIGATFVGAIHQTYTPEQVVSKGDEKGYFSFGGSCVVLLFEKGRVRFDEDLVRNSEKRIETKAHFGDSLGLAIPENEQVKSDPFEGGPIQRVPDTEQIETKAHFDKSPDSNIPKNKQVGSGLLEGVQIPCMGDPMFKSLQEKILCLKNMCIKKLYVIWTLYDFMTSSLWRSSVQWY